MTKREQSEAPFGDLHDYQTGKYLRPATRQEQADSQEAAEHDGGTGVITVDDSTCFVVD